jgi:hypothetical protein
MEPTPLPGTEEGTLGIARKDHQPWPFQAYHESPDGRLLRLPAPQALRPPVQPGSKLTWSLLHSPHSWHAEEVRDCWARLVRQSNDINLLYKTPDWFDHLHQESCSPHLVLAVARDEAGELVGVAPLRLASFPLGFHVSGKTLGTFSLLKLWMLGGAPLIPEEANAYDGLFETLHVAFPECQAVGLGGIPERGWMWRHVHTSPVVRERFLPYVVDGVRSVHTLPLPRTFDDYLAQLSRKRRYNLKREVRVLRDHGGGSLRLGRIDSKGGTAEFLDAIEAVGSERSYVPGVFAWPQDRTRAQRKLADAASRGLLRSYVLHSGSEPVACMAGYQYEDIYYVSFILHQRGLARLSPGTVLLHLAIEDLIQHRPAGLINFGFGDPVYRFNSTQVSLRYGNVVLFRNTVGNRLRRWVHAGFQGAITSAKRVLIGLHLHRGRMG